MFSKCNKSKLLSIFIIILFSFALNIVFIQPAQASAYQGNETAYGYVFDNETPAQSILIGSDMSFSSNGPLQGVTHAAGTSGITVNNAGVYKITFSVNTAGNNPEGWGIAVNGTVQEHFTASGQSIGASTKLALQAGDIVSLRNVDSSGTVNLRAGVNSAWMQIDQVNDAYGYVFDNETPAQSIPIGSDMLFSSNGPLQGVTHTAGTSGITVNNAGIYNITFAVNTWGNNPEGWGIAVNGTVQEHFTASGQSIGASAKLALQAGDIVSLRNVDSSGTANLRPGVNSAWMQIDQVKDAYGYVFDNETPAQSIAKYSDMSFSSNGPLLGVTHAAGTSGITVNNAGIYNITFAVNTWGNNPEGWGIAVNGTVQQNFTAAGQSIGASAKLALQAGDVVSLRNVATSGTSANLRPGVISAWMQIDKVDDVVTPETLTVSNPTTTGFTVTLNPSLADLAKSDFTLLDSSGQAVDITDAKMSDSGATYVISAALSAGQTYTVTAAKTVYTFGTAQSVVVPPEECLVTYQGVQKKTNDDGTYDIRFIATINTLEPDSVGFVFSKSEPNPTIGNVDTSVVSTTTVYDSIVADGKIVKADSVGTGGKYIIACTVTGISGDDVNKPLNVRAFSTKGAETTYTSVHTVTVGDLQ